MNIDSLECPCCGDDGAFPNANGLYYDEQALVCGCLGLVAVDEDGVAYISINDTEPCPTCESGAEAPHV